VQGKTTEADTANPGVHHSIYTYQRPTSLIPPFFFTSDALPAASLPIYPGLGQAPNMLACIASGLVLLQKLISSKITFS